MSAASFRSARIAQCVCLALSGLPLVAVADDSASTTPGAISKVEILAQRTVDEGSAKSGYRSSTATLGPLGNAALQDTPYSINVTSHELFENRNAHTVSDALKTNPTVSSLMDSGTYVSMSRVMVRGFTAADQSDLRDGLADRSFTYVPLENVERIEVLNGLSSFLYGFSAMGGTVNYVSKAPSATPMASFATGQYGGGLNYLHGDAGGPLDADGRWRYRANVYGEEGSSFVEGSQSRRNFFSAALSYALRPDTLLWADAWHQSLDMRGLQTYININPAKGIAIPDASRFDAKTQYGQDWSYNKAEKTLLGLGLESALGSALKLRAAWRNGSMWRDYQWISATLTDNAGNYTESAGGSTRQTEQTHSGYALIDASFPTGPLKHKLSAGYTGTSYLYTRGDDVSASLGSSSIDAPVSFANPALLVGATNVWYQQAYRNWVLGDSVELARHWSALLGLTRAELQQKRWGSGTTLATPDYTQSKLTPSIALLYKPISKLTTYASYMQGLANGGVAPSTAANAYAMLAPSVSTQYEAGLKGTLGDVDLAAALFRIDKINEYTDPSDKVYKQDGREIHQGLELTASGKPAARLTVVGGLTLMDAEVKQARNNPSLEGKTPVNVAERQGRIYLEYAPASLAGLVLSAAANYFGKRPVDAANTSYLDDATTFDVGARYALPCGQHRLSLNFTVSNLTDKAYWSYYRSGDGLLLGAPRIVAASVKADW